MKDKNTLGHINKIILKSIIYLGVTICLIIFLGFLWSVITYTFDFGYNMGTLIIDYYSQLLGINYIFG